MSYNRNFHQKILNIPKDRIKTSGGIVDMHIHMVDFVQDTDGLKSLIKIMDKANVTKSVVFGLPVKKKWEYFEPEEPHYYLDDNSRCYYYSLTDEIVAQEYLQLSNKNQKRIAPTICGFNPTDLGAIEYVEYMFNKYPFWKGIGELLLRHDDLTNLTMDEVARVNHPALFPIFDFCGQKNLPVHIHQNSTSISHHDRFEYLHELTEVLKEFPNTKFIWAHCGTSRRVTHKNYAKMIKELLDSYQNLYVDIAWIVYDDIICTDLTPKKSWLDIINKYSDRVMIGSDLCGHFTYLGKTMARYNTLLELLPKSVEKMIARENAEALWFS